MDRQMSVGPMFEGKPGPGGLYSEVQCIVGNGHMGTSFRREQTDTS